jgi:MHS family proline/betaine transporter-like MFS transporter
MWVAAFSTVVEWYDFTLYVFKTTVLSRALFGPARWCLAM